MSGPEGLIFKDESYAIVGACFEVYNQMGSGFAEQVYQECLEMELSDRKIPFESQVDLRLSYKGRNLNKRYQPDFVGFGEIILEIKASKEIVNEHRGQVINYLKATDFKLGLLVNFGKSSDLEWQRIVN